MQYAMTIYNRLEDCSRWVLAWLTVLQWQAQDLVDEFEAQIRGF